MTDATKPSLVLPAVLLDAIKARLPGSLEIDLGQLPVDRMPSWVSPLLLNPGANASWIKPVLDDLARIIQAPVVAKPPSSGSDDIGLPAFVTESEPNDSASSADAISLSLPVVGQLSSKTDIDWFRVSDLSAGQLRVNFAASTSMRGLTDTFMVRVLDASATEIAKFPVGHEASFSMQLKAPAASLLLSVGAADGVVFDSGNYKLRVDVVQAQSEPAPAPGSPAREVERNDSQASANALSLGSAIVGALDSRSDVDWFVSKVSADGRVRFGFDAANDSRWFDRFALEVVDSRGVSLAKQSAGGDTAIDVAVKANTLVYVGIKSAGMVYDASPYKLSAIFSSAISPVQGAITGTARADFLKGDISAPNVNDVFDGLGGDDRINGLGGTDVAIFHAPAANLEVITLEGLTAVRGDFAAGVYARSTAKLWNVETLRTDSGDISLVPVTQPVSSTSSTLTTAVKIAADPGAFSPIVGGARSEKIVGTAGNDLIDGAGGSDTIEGGAGSDTLALFAAADKFRVDAIAGIAHVVGLEGSAEYAGQRIVATGVEQIVFASGSPVVVAPDSRARIIGTPAADLLRGTSADEVFDGLGGFDMVDGGAGVDTLALFGKQADFSVQTGSVDRPESIITGLKGSGEYAGQRIVIRNIESLAFTDGTIAVAEPARLLVTPSATQLVEGGAPVTVQVALSAQPAQGVTVALRPSDQIKVDVTRLSFDASNWNSPQTVTVSAVDDTLVEPVQQAKLGFFVTTSASGTSALASQVLALSVSDNDVLNVGSAAGRLWQDADRDGTQDADETGLAGWVVFVDQDGDGVLDQGESRVRSDLNGNWRIDGLDPGEYTVVAQVRAGWQLTYPGGSAEGATLVDTNPGSGDLVVSDLELTAITAAQAADLADHLGLATHLADFRADSRFAGIDGSGSTIVLIDTGIDLDNAAFTDRIVYQYDFSGADDASAEDRVGHGTHVAGIAAGAGSIYPGVASGANIIALKVFDDAGNGRSSDLRQAIDWVLANVDTYNIVAVNLSLGFGQFDDQPTTGFLSSPLKALSDSGVAVVAASGNGYAGKQVQGVAYPSSDPYAMSVGAVFPGSGFWSNTAAGITQMGSTDVIAAFSQRDDTESDVFAPGVGITSNTITGGYMAMSGTSMATPQVTGMIALAQQLAQRELGRRLDVDELRALIDASSTPIIDGDDAAERVVKATGLSFGRIDMLALAEAIIDRPPPVSQTVTVVAGQTATGADFGFAAVVAPEGQAADDLIVGTRWGEKISGGDGSDRLQGGAGNDTLLGGAGDDLLLPGTGDDWVDGGDGTDTVIYAGARSTYVLSAQTGQITVQAADGSLDQLFGIEALLFSDGAVDAAGLPIDTAPLVTQTASVYTDSTMDFFMTTTSATSGLLPYSDPASLFEVRTSTEGNLSVIEVWVKPGRAIQAADLIIRFDSSKATYQSFASPANWLGLDSPVINSSAPASSRIDLSLIDFSLSDTGSDSPVGGTAASRLAAVKFLPAANSGALSLSVSVDSFTDVGSNTYTTDIIMSASLTAQTALAGKVVDGYISGATVFIDQDGDFIKDATEPSTVTGIDGSFSLPSGVAGALIAVGGAGARDISTNKSFSSALMAPSGYTVVNPLTSLIAGYMGAKSVTESAARSKIAAVLGVDAGLLNQDVLALAASGNSGALSAQKLAAQLANIVQVGSAVIGAGSETKLMGAVVGFIDTLPAGSTLQPESLACIQSVLNGAAAQMSPAVTIANSSNVFTSISNLNGLIKASTATGMTALQDIAKVQSVAQGALIADIADGGLTSATPFSGTSLTSAVAAAQVGTLVPVPMVQGTASADALSGASGNQFILGLAGDDTAADLSAGDVFIGGAGSDLAKFSGAASDYVVKVVSQDGFNQLQGQSAGALEAGKTLYVVEALAAGSSGPAYVQSERIQFGTSTPVDPATLLSSNGTAASLIVDSTSTDAAVYKSIASAMAALTTQSVITIRAAHVESSQSVSITKNGLHLILEGTADAPKWTFQLAEDTNVRKLWLDGVRPADIIGNSFDNVLRGHDGANRIDGGAGNDKILGAGGDDDLQGGAGNDWVDGGAGFDIAQGGSGNDMLMADEGGMPGGARSADILMGGSGDDLLFVATEAAAHKVGMLGGSGNDVFRVASLIGAGGASSSDANRSLAFDAFIADLATGDGLDLSQLRSTTSGSTTLGSVGSLVAQAISGSGGDRSVDLSGLKAYGIGTIGATDATAAPLNGVSGKLVIAAADDAAISAARNSAVLAGAPGMNAIIDQALPVYMPFESYYGNS